jgi:predicted small lipoprotein YifL
MRRLLTAAIVFAVAAVMAGCGVRGPLEPPPSVTGEPAAAPAPAGTKGRPAKPFVLDGLL